MAQRAGVESIDRRQGFANVKFHQQSKIDTLKLMQLVRTTSGAQFTPAGVLKWPLKAFTNPADLIDDLRQMLVELTADAEVVVRG
jgi:transcription-repair coupling factor (superfamily II helicase)